MGASLLRPPKGVVAARFGRRAACYESGAAVQMEIVRRVAALMRGGIGAGELWCDFGSGGGMLAERVGPLPAGTRFVCLDLAFAPLRLALRSLRASMAVNGDMDSLPLRPRALDGASATSVLQWVERPEEALRGVARALKPGGRFYVAAFVAGSFAELVETRARMGLPAAVWLPTASELLMALDRAGFDVPADGIENFETERRFPDALSALCSLSATGVTATGGRLLNRTELDAFCRDYTLTFAKDGTVPLTYRAVIAAARVRAE